LSCTTPHSLYIDIVPDLDLDLDSELDLDSDRRKLTDTTWTIGNHDRGAASG